MEGQALVGWGAYHVVRGDYLPGGQHHAQIEALLPKNSGINAKTLVAKFFTSIQMQMDADHKGYWNGCTPLGFRDALLDVARLGLYPGNHGHVYVYPFKGVPTVVLGYKGMLVLMKRVPGVVFSHAETVFEADEFDFQNGTNAFLHHKKSLEKDRGEVIAAWARVEYVSGPSQFYIMPKHEIDAVKTNTQVWRDHYNRQARKSATRQLYNLVGTDDAAVHLAAQIVDREMMRDAVRVSEDTPRALDAPVARPAIDMTNQYATAPQGELVRPAFGGEQ